MSDNAADSFHRLWTPYRMAYIQGADKPKGEPAQTEDCPFCLIPQMSDEDGLIVARGNHCYVVLNKYPYNAGHLMVLPFRHVPEYVDIDQHEIAEFSALTQKAIRVVRAVTGAQGFNIGMNQGAAGGAGIAAHLHQHLVPRWGGDTNFMPVVGMTRVLPQLLADTRDLLAQRWEDSGE